MPGCCSSRPPRASTARKGLLFELCAETSWANLRDKLALGIYDAAHMLAPAVVASTLGLDGFAAPMIGAVALGLDGNAISVAPALAAALREKIDGDARDPVVTARALAALVAERRAQGIAAAAFRPCLSLFHAPLPAQAVDARGRCRSRGRPPDGDAAAADGGKPARRLYGRLLRRRALEHAGARGRRGGGAASVPRPDAGLPREGVGLSARSGARRAGAGPRRRARRAPRRAVGRAARKCGRIRPPDRRRARRRRFAGHGRRRARQGRKIRALAAARCGIHRAFRAAGAVALCPDRRQRPDRGVRRPGRARAKGVLGPGRCSARPSAPAFFDGPFDPGAWWDVLAALSHPRANTASFVAADVRGAYAVWQREEMRSQGRPDAPGFALEMCAWFNSSNESRKILWFQGR